MKREIKDKFPKWVNDNEWGKYVTCMSDDIDSLIGVKLLEQVKGYEANYFFDFENVYIANTENNKIPIGVDIAFMKGKTWDNHVTMRSSRDSINKNSANLNAILKINRDNYTEKYAGSTSLQIWSHYGLPLPKTEEGKMLLLAVDSAYLGHYEPKFHDVHNRYLERLEMTELIDVLNRHKQREFGKMKVHFDLNSKISVNDHGNLETSLDLKEIGLLLNLDLSLPDKSFSLYREYQTGFYNKGKKLPENIISFALTSKDRGKYTYR